MKKFGHVSELVKSFSGEEQAGVSIAIWHKGKEVHRQYEGWENIEKRKPADEDTIFRIYSMTKVVTCVSALILYERGKFLLNEPLYNYFPQFKDLKVYQYGPRGDFWTESAKNPITIKDLFCMTSGITYPGDNMPTAIKTAEKFEKWGHKTNLKEMTCALAEVPVSFEPGERWCYGLSHDVLAALVEEISGKKFGQFLSDEIFGPLKMENTYFRFKKNTEQRLCDTLVFDEKGGFAVTKDDDELYRPSSKMESGGAGLLSTLDDYLRFARMLLNNGELDGEKVVGRKTVELMRTNQVDFKLFTADVWPHLKGYGYGLGVRTLVDPALNGSNAGVGEWGWAGLLGTWVSINPAENLCYVYMQQRVPSLESERAFRLNNAVYGAI